MEVICLMHVSQMCWEGTYSSWGFLLHPTALSLLEAEIPILGFRNLPRCFILNLHILLLGELVDSAFPPWTGSPSGAGEGPGSSSTPAFTWDCLCFWKSFDLQWLLCCTQKVCPLWWKSFNKRFVKRNYYKLALWFWTWNRYRPYGE